MPNTTELPLISQPTAAFIPYWTSHVPQQWIANVNIEHFRPQDEWDMAMHSTYFSWMTRRNMEVLLHFKEISDFILHRVILSGYAFDSLLDALVPGDDLSKATKLNEVLLSGVCSTQEQFHRMLHSRGEKYGFTLGEIKSLIYISTLPDDLDDRPMTAPQPQPFLPQPQLCSGRKGGFKDEESLYTFFSSVQWCDARLPIAQSYLADCPFWKPASSAHIRVTADRMEYLNSRKDFTTFRAVEQFRPIIRKLLICYTNVSKSIADGTFSP